MIKEKGVIRKQLYVIGRLLGVNLITDVMLAMLAIKV